MRTRRTAVAAAAAVMAMAATAVWAGPSGAGGRPFSTELSGAQEIADPPHPHGDADRGSISLTLNHGQREVCYRLGPLTLTAGEALPFAGHIHVGAAGSNGPVVVPLFGGSGNPSPPTSYPTDEVCVAADRDTIKAIIQNPEGYYVNLHNSTHPGGVVRGQLSKK